MITHDMPNCGHNNLYIENGCIIGISESMDK